MWSNNLRQSRNTIYKLKQNYGKVAYLRKPTTSTSDVTTGKMTRAYDVHRINKAVILPIDTLKTFIYDLTYVAANKNFTYGAYFDKSSSFVIIDPIDLPLGLEIAESIDQIIVGTVKYEVAKSERFEAAWYLGIKAVLKADPVTDPYTENQ